MIEHPLPGLLGKAGGQRPVGNQSMQRFSKRRTITFREDQARFVMGDQVSKGPYA